MSNPLVRETGRVEDIDGTNLVIGTDYDAVTIGYPGSAAFRLTIGQAEEFGQLFVRACWEAGANAERMRQESDNDPCPGHDLAMPHDSRYSGQRSCPPNCPYRKWCERRGLMREGAS